MYDISQLDQRVKQRSISESHLVKGTAVKNLKHFLDARLGTTHFELLAEKYQLKRPNAPILLSSWYSANAVINLELEAAHMLKKDIKSFFIAYSRFTIEEDLNGIYRSFMRLGGAVRMLSAAPRIIRSYLNYMDCQVLINERGYNQSYIEVPKVLNDISIYTIQGAVQGILNVCKNEMNSFDVVAESKILKGGEDFANIVLEVRYT